MSSIEGQQTSILGKCRNLGAAVQDGEVTRLFVAAELAADHLVIICLSLLFARKGGVLMSCCSIEKELHGKPGFKRGSRDDLVA